MHRRTRIITRTTTGSLTALLLAGSLIGTAASPVSAQPAERAKPTTRVLAKGLVSPLSLAVRSDGVRYFAQNFAGLLMRQAPGRKPEVIFSAPKQGLEVGAVSVQGDRVVFAVSGRGNKVGRINTFGPGGKAFTRADLYAFEKRANPDGRITYGFRTASKKCLDKVEGFPGLYQGIKETHPFATLIDGRRTFVADAGGNSIVKVGPGGRVSTVAALPALPARINAKSAKAFGLPRCVVGKQYWFEAVPTDVEMGPDGWLYVTNLPGGPEDPSLGARGAVVKVNPATGRVVTVASGLVTPTGLAVAPRGDLFVAQLFAGSVLRIKKGTGARKQVLSAPLPSDVEMSGRRLYALVNSLPGEDKPPNGKLLRVGY